MKNLTELQAECVTLGIRVEAKGRASKEPFIAALRDYHWRTDHPHEPMPVQIMPMLLGSWEDLDEEEAQQIEQDHHAWIVQPKMDGVRALLHVEEGRVRITSRTISEVTFRLSELEQNLGHLTTGLSKLTGTILDGELVCPVSSLNTGSTITSASLQATMAVLATSPDHAVRIQKSGNAHLRFHVFDILHFCGKNVTQLPLIERQDFLEKALQESDNACIEAVPTFVVNKLEIHSRIIDSGGEGTVWKKVDGRYAPGRRVQHWIKRKKGIEVEAIVSGFKAGANGHAQLVGALEFSVRDRDGSVRPIAWVSNFTDQERVEMTERPGMNYDVGLERRFLGRKASIAGHDVSAKSRRFRHARIQKWID